MNDTTMASPPPSPPSTTTTIMPSSSSSSPSLHHPLLNPSSGDGSDDSSSSHRHGLDEQRTTGLHHDRSAVENSVDLEQDHHGDDNENNNNDNENTKSCWVTILGMDHRHGKCRFVLIFVSFLFATFNISARAVYSFDDAPSPSVFSTIRGYMVVIFFVPLLINKQRQQRTREQQEEPKNNDTAATTTTRGLVGEYEQEDENDEESNSILSLLSMSETTSQQQEHDDNKIPDMTNDRNEDEDENESDRRIGLPHLSSSSSSSLWMSALELSIWNFVSQACYNVGIMSVSSSARASFLGQSSVIMTPFIVVCLSRNHVSVATWTGCFVAMIGLSFLSWTPTTTTTAPTTDPTHPTDDGNDNNTTAISFVISTIMNFDQKEEDILAGSPVSSSSSPSSSKVGLSFGDWMILLSSATWSFYIIRTCAHSTKYDEVYLQGLKNIFNALFYTGWWLLDSNFGRNNLWSGWNGPMAVASWSILTYSAFGPGILADLLQQNAQSSVPASEANIILSMEPIFTAALGFMLLHENLTWNESVGGCFMVLGSLVASSMATEPIPTLSPEH